MLRTGPNGAKTGIGLNITNLFDPDAVFPSMRSRGYATAIFGKIHNARIGFAAPTTTASRLTTSRPSARRAVATTEPVPTSG